MDGGEGQEGLDSGYITHLEKRKERMVVVRRWFLFVLRCGGKMEKSPEDHSISSKKENFIFQNIQYKRHSNFCILF